MTRDPVAPVIAVRDLTKHYGGTVGVDSLEFSVERGEVFGFLGPNGAGKTSTIRLLLGRVAMPRSDHLLGAVTEYPRQDSHP